MEIKKLRNKIKENNIFAQNVIKTVEDTNIPITLAEYLTCSEFIRNLIRKEINKKK